MEEEKIETTQEQENNKTKKFDYKKYLPYAGIALAVVVVIIILLAVLRGGPKNAVEKFISGMNNQNSKKIVKSIDIIGTAIWNYYGDEDDFEEEDYKQFIKAYDKYLSENKVKLDDKINDLIEDLNESFDEFKENYKTYKVKIEKFKSVEEIGKDLYVVKAKISKLAEPKDEKKIDEIDESKVKTIIVYKNKVISGMGI